MSGRGESKKIHSEISVLFNIMQYCCCKASELSDISLPTDLSLSVCVRVFVCVCMCV